MSYIPKSLWGIIIAAVVAGIAALLIIWNFDPNVSKGVVFILLFMAILIFVSGVTISIYFLYKYKKGDLDVLELMPESVQQGLILSFVITILLILQTLHVLTWWNSLFIIVIAVILNMYFKR